MGALTFQRGDPVGLDIFGPQAPSFDTTASSSSDGVPTGHIEGITTSRDVHHIASDAGVPTRDIQVEEVEEPMSPRAIDAMIANALANGGPHITETQHDVVPEPENAIVMHSQPSSRHLVGDQDAQRVYSHTSCVFIAK
jgi:hypothetical protein